MATFNDLFLSLKNATKSSLNTTLGNSSSIYKEEVFSGLNDSEKKKARSKIRNYIISIFETITSTTCTNENKIKLVNAFLAFYSDTYKVTDFSVTSICNENSKHKDLFEKGLAICKEYQTKQNKSNKSK